MVSPMITQLRELTHHCELIAFTFLPRPFVEQFLTKVPEVKNFFSYVFCQEDMVQADDYFIKDLTPLLYSRPSSDLIIIDVDETRIDEEYFSSIVL
jgi:NLI interacting factor-like phosphatase